MLQKKAIHLSFIFVDRDGCLVVVSNLVGILMTNNQLLDSPEMMAMEILN